ncbi:MAG: acylphosphatase [Magnetococcales bacterium]|nr:acylphosphatase [Magnetococcales bacterium]
MPQEQKICRHIQVFGRVQGVWYRGSTQKEAIRLGLVGWVRNRADGSVEGELIGLAGDIEKMIAWCRQGPPLASVTRMEVSEQPVPQKIPGKFEVRY